MADKAAPAGWIRQLPMGRTNKPNPNRIIVVLQVPLIYLAVLIFIILRAAIDSDASEFRAPPTFGLAWFSILMLVVQQAQLGGERKLMRKRLN